MARTAQLLFQNRVESKAKFRYIKKANVEMKANAYPIVTYGEKQVAKKPKNVAFRSILATRLHALSDAFH